jgi:hypothetical protein
MSIDTLGADDEPAAEGRTREALRNSRRARIRRIRALDYALRASELDRSSRISRT